MSGTGGPISGGGAGAFAKFTRPDILNGPGIIVPTVLQIAADTLDQFAGLTCLYNKDWFNRQDMATLPLAFFYITDIEEIMETEISEQRVMVYDPSLVESDSTVLALSQKLRPGVQEVVADNTIIKPKSYQLSIVLPFKIAGGLFARQMNDLMNMFTAFGEVLSGASGLAPYFAGVTGTISLANKALTAFDKLPSGSSSASYINKNSLEAMWRSKKILTFKMWDGYNYKYVMITSFRPKKIGKEDDVFRASLTLREVPVLTINAANNAQLTGFDRGWAATAITDINQALVDPFVALTGVGQASL